MYVCKNSLRPMFQVLHEPLIDEDPVFIATCTERELRKRKKRKFSLWVRQCTSTGFICQVSAHNTRCVCMWFGDTEVGNFLQNHNCFRCDLRVKNYIRGDEKEMIADFKSYSLNVASFSIQSITFHRKLLYIFFILVNLCATNCTVWV